MSKLRNLIPADYRAVLSQELASEAFAELERKLEVERERFKVFPIEKNTFRALMLTPYREVKVVILGQDPYHEELQAQGLAFSVADGVKFPPSLKNIFKELSNDLELFWSPENGDLSSWAKQGVLLLNTVLTVRAHEANSHKDWGWEALTDGVIRAVNALPEPVVFLLWGAPAQRKKSLIDGNKHLILESAHPSPLSAYRGFFGSRPFSKCNEFLVAHGRTPIEWMREF